MIDDLQLLNEVIKDVRKNLKQRIANRKYANSHKEKLKKERKTRYFENREREIQRSIKWNKNNRDKTRANSKQYRINNPEKVKECDRIAGKKYRTNNKEKINNTKKLYRLKNKEKIKLHNKIYNEINRENFKTKKQINEQNRRKTDINFKLAANLRRRLRYAMKTSKRPGSSVRDMGCSIDEFNKYFESKFTLQMNWPAYMRGDIHIDHIIPLSRFDLTNREEFLKAVHYTNLQPLWATTKIAREHGDMTSIGNIDKGNK